MSVAGCQSNRQWSEFRLWAVVCRPLLYEEILKNVYQSFMKLSFVQGRKRVLLRGRRSWEGEQM